MAKLAKPLSDKALKALKTTGKNSIFYDGQGLQIMATIYGKKTWRFTYTFDGKRKMITLGNYPDISLALARELASQKQALVAQGIDSADFDDYHQTGTSTALCDSIANYEKKT